MLDVEKRICRMSMRKEQKSLEFLLVKVELKGIPEKGLLYF